MISIIIPILNEEKSIPAIFEHLASTCSTTYTSEIIIVDGGSTDSSLKVIAQFLQDNDAFPMVIKISKSQKGRAKQMNYGAMAAQGTILYFLHVDSFPPPDFDQLISEMVSKGHKAGCFQMKFDHSHWWLRLMGWCTRFDSRICRGGDQSQFITKDLFDDMRGFDESFIIYEDNDLINRLYDRNEFKVIPKFITTSARKYEEIGIWKLQYHFLVLHIKSWLSADPSELYEYYKRKVVK